MGSQTVVDAAASPEELEALERDGGDMERAAAPSIVEHGERAAIRTREAHARRCLWLIVPVLVLSAVAAGVGVAVRARGGGDGADSAADAPAVVPQGVSAASTPTFAVRVLRSHPHDRLAFTQGFEYARGSFYESTGQYGSSSLRKVDVETGNVTQRFSLPDLRLFGEGMTLHNTHHIFMLTWKAGRGFVFNQTTFEVIKEWKYEGQGWGLCTDPVADEVYMSDGTTQLRVLDPDDLSEKRRINVTLNGKEVSELNELEWICGEVWANVWQQKTIYRIDPTTGVVKSIIDATILPLPADKYPGQDVLNGIAFDKETGRLWFTGKLWSKIYQVEVTDDSLDLTACKEL